MEKHNIKGIRKIPTIKVKQIENNPRRMVIAIPFFWFT